MSEEAKFVIDFISMYWPLFAWMCLMGLTTARWFPLKEPGRVYGVGWWFVLYVDVLLQLAWAAGTFVLLFQWWAVPILEASR